MKQQTVITPRAVTALFSICGGVLLGAGGGILIGLLIGVGLWCLMAGLGFYR